MKTSKLYSIYISYKPKVWHSIDRSWPDVDKAMRALTEIAGNHKPTTRLALVCTTTEVDTILVKHGYQEGERQPQYIKCKQCDANRFRKNINPQTGVCLKCEMRNEIETQTARVYDH